MSEKPKGSGFDLPEDFIKAVDKVAAKKEGRKQYETKAERRKRLTEERKSKVVSEKTPEEVDEEVEVVESFDVEEDKDVVWERPEKGVRENVPARMGGLNSRKKADDLLDDADRKDIDRSIFERAKVFAENKKGKTKRPLKENLAKVNFNDPDELEIEMPDEESIEGSEFNSVKNLKEDVNKRVGGFDSQKVASRLVEKSNYDDYEHVLEQSISKAESIDQLLQIIDTQVDDKKGLQGSQDNFKKSDLKMIIGMLRDNEPGVGIEHVTRSAGLRQKVFDLLNESSSSTPQNKYVTGESVPVPPDLTSKQTIDEPEESVVELSPVKIEGAREDSKIVKKNKPLVGDDKPVESVYSPEQFAKDQDVLVLPKNETVTEVKNELPEAPLKPLNESDYPEMSEEEKNLFEIRRDVAKLEIDLDLKRKELQGLILDKEDAWDAVEGKPWKKFLLKIDLKGKMKKMGISVESAAKEFKKLTEELIERKTDRRLYELHAMHPNTKERKEVEMVRLVDVPADLLKKYPEAIEVFEENGKVIHINALNKAAIKLPREFKEAVNDIYPDIVRSKVMWQVRNDHRASEKQDLLQYLSQD